MADGSYPRLLIISRTPVLSDDAGTFALRNLLHGWPRESLAAIGLSTPTRGETVCGRSYLLGESDRVLGSLFFKVKPGALLDAMQYVDASAVANAPPSVRKRITRWAVKTQLWQEVFRPRLGPDLRRFVEGFRPDCIYVNGYDPTLCRLPLLLSRAYGIPMVYATGDDWTRWLGAGTGLQPITRMVAERAARRLIRACKARVCTGEAMQAEFEKRYGVPFTILMLCDTYDRFRAVEPSARAFGKVRILYSGNLAHNRWKGLVDICAAARTLARDGIDLEILAYSSVVPVEAVEILNSEPNLRFMPALAHEDVPQAFRDADILFLPESFDPVAIEHVRFSISTKAHLYMMARRPIIAYGGGRDGVIGYARNFGWARVVDQEGAGPLAEAIRELCGDPGLCERLVARGLEVALARHERDRVTARFRDLIEQAAGARS